MSKTNFDDYLERKLKDPEFARDFEAAGQEWDLAIQLARERKAAGLSQADLASKAGTTQQQISKMEQPGYKGSLQAISRVANALGVVLVTQLMKPTAQRSERRNSRGITRGRVSSVQGKGSPKVAEGGRGSRHAAVKTKAKSPAKAKVTR